MSALMLVSSWEWNTLVFCPIFMLTVEFIAKRLYFCFIASRAHQSDTILVAVSFARLLTQLSIYTIHS